MEKDSLMAKIRRFIHSGARFRVVLIMGRGRRCKKNEGDATGSSTVSFNVFIYFNERSGMKK
jgi:hypothetical protein